MAASLVPQAVRELLSSNERGLAVFDADGVLWHGDGVNQKYLSDATGVAENTTAKLITAMEKRGLVTRTRDRIDRRQLLIALTDSGRALEQELLPYAVEINSAATKGIEPEDVETCLSVLNRMSENLERELLSQPEG